MGTLKVKWFNPRTGELYSQTDIRGGRSKEFVSLFSGDAVLHVSKGKEDVKNP